jgi:hypothetical protein
MYQNAPLASAHRGKGKLWILLDTALFGRVQVCVATILCFLALMGCMSINVGGGDSKPCADSNGFLVQEGKIPVRNNGDLVIYYPKPYTSPPNLEIEDGNSVCEIVEQKENSFRVHFKPTVAVSQQSITWKARGAQPVVPEIVPTGAVTPASSLTGPVPASTNSK